MSFKILLAALLISLSGPLLANPYLEQGIASTDREWRGNDYLKLVQAIENKKVPLFHLEDAEGARILKQVSSLENLSFYRNKQLPIETRIADFMLLVGSVARLPTFYYPEIVPGDAVHEEMAMLISNMLHVSAAGIELMAEYVPTLPQDDKYETRMAGLSQFKRGCVTTYSGSVTSLLEDSIHSDEGRSQILAAMATTTPVFKTIFSEDTQTEMRQQLTAARGRFTGEADRKNMDLLLMHLKAADPKQ